MVGSGEIPRAVLDTNVLFPPVLRDLLLNATEHGLYQLVWSGEILEELRRNLVKVARLPPAVAERRVAWMIEAFPDSMRRPPTHGTDILGVDAKDQHVAILAIASDAMIVTENLRHFPLSALSPFGVTAVSPDEFVMELLDAFPDEMLDVIRDYAGMLRSPPTSHDELLQRLARHVPRFSEAARRLL